MSDSTVLLLLLIALNVGAGCGGACVCAGVVDGSTGGRDGSAAAERSAGVGDPGEDREGGAVDGVQDGDG